MLHDVSLPDDSLPEAMHDEEMVDDMFWLRIQRQRDQQNRQPFAPATGLTTITAVKPQQSMHNLTVERLAFRVRPSVLVITLRQSWHARPFSLRTANHCHRAYADRGSRCPGTKSGIVAMDQTTQHLVVKIQAGLDGVRRQNTSLGRHRRHAGARPSSAGFTTCRVRQSSLPGI